MTHVYAFGWGLFCLASAAVVSFGLAYVAAAKGIPVHGGAAGLLGAAVGVLLWTVRRR